MEMNTSCSQQQSQTMNLMQDSGGMTGEQGMMGFAESKFDGGDSLSEALGMSEGDFTEFKQVMYEAFYDAATSFLNSNASAMGMGEAETMAASEGARSAMNPTAQGNMQGLGQAESSEVIPGPVEANPCRHTCASESSASEGSAREVSGRGERRMREPDPERVRRPREADPERVRRPRGGEDNAQAGQFHSQASAIDQAARSSQPAPSSQRTSAPSAAQASQYLTPETAQTLIDMAGGASNDEPQNRVNDVSPSRASYLKGSPDLFTGTSPAGKGAFEIGGETFGHAYWASGSGFMADKAGQQDLGAYIDAAKAEGKTAQVVVYGLGDENGGDAQMVENYEEYIKTVSDLIGDADAEIFFEPDLSGLHADKMSDPMILDGISYLDKNNPNAKILMDTTHSNWHTDLSQYIPDYKAMQAAGADGFVGNVSNYRPTDELAQWMHKELYGEFGDDMIYSIDTSRNGAGAAPAGVKNGEWADVAGAGLGEKSGGSMNFKGMDLQFRHVKPATESDVAGGPGSLVSEDRLKELFQNSIFA